MTAPRRARRDSSKKEGADEEEPAPRRRAARRAPQPEPEDDEEEVRKRKRWKRSRASPPQEDGVPLRLRAPRQEERAPSSAERSRGLLRARPHVPLQRDPRALARHRAHSVRRRHQATRLPPINALEIPPRPPSVTLVGVDGTTLATRGDGSALKVDLKHLPDYLPQAFVAIEDQRFRSHFGVDPIGLMRAAYQNLVAGQVVQGGSTLTQQSAKNLFLTPERSFERKVQEAILALWLSETLKGRRFELYRTASISGRAPTAYRRRASAISASPQATSRWRKPRFSQAL